MAALHTPGPMEPLPPRLDMFVVPICGVGIDLSGPGNSPDQCPIQQIPSQLLRDRTCNDGTAASVLPRHRDYFEHLHFPTRESGIDCVALK